MVIALIGIPCFTEELDSLPNITKMITILETQQLTRLTYEYFSHHFSSARDLTETIMKYQI